MSTYDSFAYFYDQYKEGDDYHLFMSQYIEIAKFQGLKGNRILDLGCGTGTSMLPLLERDFQVEGVDNSIEMLSMAREKLSLYSPKLHHQSIDTVQVDSYFDLAIAVDDVMNHLLSESSLSKCFASVHKTLNEEALFIFDVNSYSTFEKYFDMTHVYEEKGHTYIWKATYTDGHGQADITRFQLKEEQYVKQSSQVNERYYSKEILCKLLSDNNFELLDIYGYSNQSFNKQADESQDLKCLYVARKC